MQVVPAQLRKNLRDTYSLVYRQEQIGGGLHAAKTRVVVHVQGQIDRLSMSPYGNWAGYDSIPI